MLVVSLRMLRLVTVAVLLAVLAGAAVVLAGAAVVLAGAAVVLAVLLARAWEAFCPCSTPASSWRLSVALPAVALAPAGG